MITCVNVYLFIDTARNLFRRGLIRKPTILMDIGRGQSTGAHNAPNQPALWRNQKLTLDPSTVNVLPEQPYNVRTLGIS
jgi:hypothetical protein